MIRKLNIISFIAVALIAVTGCIKNDIPYPRIQPDILTLTAEHQLKETEIDPSKRLATLYLTEEADIYNVNITECTVTKDAVFVGDAIEGTIDLSSPQYYKLKLYQEYIWTVKVVQNIERYFSVDGQIGSSMIDVPGRRVVLTLPEHASLKDVKVLTAKLGSVNSTIHPNIFAENIDLSKPLQLTVTDYGRKAIWTIYASQTESVVTTTRADAWTNVAWVYGDALEGRTNSIEYRKADSEEWIKVPDSWLTHNGGSFYARLIHLGAQTKYVARAISNDDKGNEIEFTTGINLQPENASFDTWWQDGKIWNPWAKDGLQYWDTGNKGATTLGDSNSMPTDDTATGSGLAAKLETRFIGIGSIGKLAAGNIFVGKYLRTDGTNGILSFGHEFTERPTKVRGYFKYHCVPISHATAGYENLFGTPDVCSVYAALIDTPEPFEIRTNPKNQQFLDVNGSYIVAYGKMECNHEVSEYQQFEFEFEYKSTDRKPRYLILVGTASKYGDFFTGGHGSIMYLDNLELVYDY